MGTRCGDPGSRLGAHRSFFRAYFRKLWLYLPKFSASGSYNLDELLPQLGIQDLFTRRANLSGIAAQDNLLVSKVSGQRLSARLGCGPGRPRVTSEPCDDHPGRAPRSPR